MKRVVIESPLAGDFQKNFRYALWCAYDCRLRGESPYASHLFFPLFLNDLEPEQREFGIEAGYAWSQHADVFAFYIDLSWSVGMERAKGRWTKLMQQGPHPSDKKIEHRMLSTELLARFESGEYPPGTKLFEMLGQVT